MNSSQRKNENRILQRYLEEIQREELLDPEEEIELARRISRGDRQALNRLLKSNLRFVVSVAKKYQNQGLSLEDLIAEGNVGLIKAAIRFDETRGFKFISYAVWWIRQAILEAISQKSRMVRLPMNRVDDVVRMQRTAQVLQQEYDREPTLEEVAEAMDASRSAIREARIAAKRELSVDEPRTNTGDTNLLNILTSRNNPIPDDALYNESLQLEIKRALEMLDTREAEIIRLYYGIDTACPMTLGKIGQKYNLTRERIRQIKATGLQKLRRSRIAGHLRQYLDDGRA
ncbi:MAG TPA: RNA polymerase sigma factor RpoD/SigA [bacterium]|nr:RNA polymerase sigma factor RpoD/SigA [bacterium]